MIFLFPYFIFYWTSTSLYTFSVIAINILIGRLPSLLTINTLTLFIFHLVVTTLKSKLNATVTWTIWVQSFLTFLASFIFGNYLTICTVGGHLAWFFIWWNNFIISTSFTSPLWSYLLPESIANYGNARSLIFWTFKVRITLFALTIRCSHFFSSTYKINASTLLRLVWSWNFVRLALLAGTIFAKIGHLPAFNRAASWLILIGLLSCWTSNTDAFPWCNLMHSTFKFNTLSLIFWSYLSLRTCWAGPLFSMIFYTRTAKGRNACGRCFRRWLGGRCRRRRCCVLWTWLTLWCGYSCWVSFFKAFIHFFITVNRVDIP